MPSPTVRVDSRVIRKVPPEQQEEFLAGLKACARHRAVFAKVLTETIEAAILSSEDPSVFAGPNPMLVLADLAGYRRGLREAADLLTSKETE